MAVASHAASMQRAAISDSFVAWGAKSLTSRPSCRSGLGLDGASQVCTGGREKESYQSSSREKFPSFSAHGRYSGSFGYVPKKMQGYRVSPKLCLLLWGQ